MNKIYIVVGSITNAMRGNELLLGYGINSTIKRNQSFNKTMGCGYSLEVKKNGKKAVELLRQHNIRVRDVIEGDFMK